jgi:hypothetical protein
MAGIIEDTMEPIQDQQINVNPELLEAIKNFMDDLSNVTTNQNFKDYHTIVHRIDESKVKSYRKLIHGFNIFFENNSELLKEGNIHGLTDPNISYETNNGSFTFDFQQVFNEASEEDQDVIKDHLNHIWNIFNNENKSPEELYIDGIFRDLKSRFSPDSTREEQMMIAKDLFSDFQKQNLDISMVIKAACKKARQLLSVNESENSSKTLMLVDAVEEIDINNFNMIQFMNLVGKVGSLFTDAESNPLNGMLSNMFFENNLIPIEIDQLTIDD